MTTDELVAPYMGRADYCTSDSMGPFMLIVFFSVSKREKE